MATVYFPATLLPYTSGVGEVTVDAARVAELLTAVTAQFPLLVEPLRQMAIAIDGEIYADPGYQSLGVDSEVHFVPRIAGG